MSTTSQNPTVSYLHWLPRISLFLVFVYHGFDKLTTSFGDIGGM